MDSKYVIAGGVASLAALALFGYKNKSNSTRNRKKGLHDSNEAYAFDEMMAFNKIRSYLNNPKYEYVGDTEGYISGLNGLDSRYVDSYEVSAKNFNEIIKYNVTVTDRAGIKRLNAEKGDKFIVFVAPLLDFYGTELELWFRKK